MVGKRRVSDFDSSMATAPPKKRKKTSVCARQMVNDALRRRIDKQSCENQSGRKSVREGKGREGEGEGTLLCLAWSWLDLTATVTVRSCIHSLI